jgi:diguanylate cyclase (GGDEF)-like protein/PAS domain S-box-containing protein
MVSKIVSVLARLGFWPYIFVFTFLAIIISEALILVQSYWLTGTFFDRNLLVSGFVTPAIDGFIVFFLSAFLIRHLVTVQSSLKDAEKELQDSNNRLKEVQSIAHLGFWELDLKVNRLYWSDEVYRIFGLEPQEFEATYEGFLEYVHPDDREALALEYQQSIDEKRCYNIVHRIVQKNGSVHYVEERCSHSYDSDGNPMKSIGTVYDITDRIADRNKLQRLFDLQKNIIVQTDGLSVKKANQSFLRFFNYATLEEFLEKHGCICDLFVKDDRFFHLGKVDRGETWLEALDKLPKKDRVVSLLDTNQKPHAFSVSVNQFEDNDMIVSFTDISETMLEQFSLKHKVSRDYLTGAYSREFFESNIYGLIENAEKRNSYLGLIMLDIDRFKNVNDTYGHDIGDKVLKHLVPTIKYSVRNDDLLIRWGGEEFLLIAETESAETLRRMAEHVRQRIENEPFDVIGRITCSFGMTLYEENEPIEQTIKRADRALYEAKEEGRNRVAAKLLK